MIDYKTPRPEKVYRWSSIALRVTDVVVVIDIELLSVQLSKRQATHALVQGSVNSAPRVFQYLYVSNATHGFDVCLSV